MNSISISGNLGKDCELRHLPDGTAVAAFSVADNQGRDKPSIWWRCSLFGKRADSLSQYLVKGQQVTVVGTVSEREYTNKDGIQQKAMDVRVNDIALQGGRRDDAHQPSPAPRSTQPASPATAPKGSGFDDMEDDVPF